MEGCGVWQLRGCVFAMQASHDEKQRAIDSESSTPPLPRLAAALWWFLCKRHALQCGFAGCMYMYMTNKHDAAAPARFLWCCVYLCSLAELQCGR